MSACRVVVYWVTRWLARQGTRRAVDYNKRTIVLKEVGDFSREKKSYTHLNLSRYFISGHLSRPSKSHFLKIAPAVDFTILMLQLGR